MIISDLVNEFLTVRKPGWVVLDPDTALQQAVEAARYYSAYGPIESLALADPLPGVPPPGTSVLPAWPDPEPTIYPARPVKDISFITGETNLTTGEWAVIWPLFFLYVEREQAQRLGASESSGLLPWGRSVSEIAGDISRMEDETIPNKAFIQPIVEVC